MQCHLPRQLSQEVSPQQRLNLARKGERFVQCEMGDEEAEELGAAEGREGGVLCDDGVWRGLCIVMDHLLDVVCIAVVECARMRVGAGRWRGGVHAYAGEHVGILCACAA